MNPCLAFLTHWSNFGIIVFWQFEMLINLFYLFTNIVHGRISASPPHLSIQDHCHLTAGRAGTHFQVLAWGFDLFLRQLKVHHRACSFPQHSLHGHLWYHTTRQGPGSWFVLTPLSPRLSCTYSTPLGHDFYLALFENSIQPFLCVADDGELNHPQLN